MALSPARAVMAIVPCPGAGSHSSLSRMPAARSARPSRVSPASASMVASASPAASFFSRVSTLPRMGTILRSGLRRSASAARLSEAVPTAAPSGRSRRWPATGDRKASRTSARLRQAAMTMPSGSAVGRSLAEWTARSMRPESSASSISLVNSPLPPASASGRSVMRSPVVRIGAIAAAMPMPESAVRTASACHSASGLPRVPMVRVAVRVSTDCNSSIRGVRGQRGGPLYGRSCLRRREPGYKKIGRIRG